MKKSLALLMTPAAFAFLAACGDNVENINQMGMEVVASADDLPKCTDDNEGEQAFVKDEDALRICVGGKWKTVSSNGAGTDFSCKTEELKDKSGLKIVCNGDSIGVVLNGADGKQGEAGKDGDAGTGCEIADRNDTAVVVKCGESTMTIDLNIGLPNDTAEADSERTPISLDSLVGFTQKGPFLKGSTVYLYELSDGRTLKQTNGNFTSNISQDNGRYKFLARDLVSQYAMVVVDGYYRNEVTGVSSNAPIRLKAITDMRKRNSVNVNILTHLEFERVYHLVTRGDKDGKKLTVKQAKRQAQREIMDIFNIKLDENTDAEDMDVFGSSDADAALLAISILLQGDRSESEMMALLSEISTDIAEDGLWNDSTTGNASRTKAQIADWAFTQDLSKFRKNVAGWGLGSSGVGRFEPHVNNFIAKNFGINTCSQVDSTKQTVQNRYSKFNGKQYECFNVNRTGSPNITWVQRRNNPYLNDAVTYDYLLDTRDRKVYATTKIAYYTVMAENLDYEYTLNSKPYGNHCYVDSCSKYGRYYTWAAAMDSAGLFSQNGYGCGMAVQCSMKLPAQGICPEGWHIPSTEDWFDFRHVVVEYSAYGYGSINDALAKGFEKWPDATNKSGFSVIPAGYDSNNNFYFEIRTFNASDVDSLAYFWASAEYSIAYAERWTFSAEKIEYDNKSFFKAGALTIRCFKNF